MIIIIAILIIIIIIIIIIIMIIIIIGQTSLPNESPPTWINDIFQVLISFCGDNALRISK